MPKTMLLLFILLFASFSMSAVADEVHLDDGSILFGKILLLQEGKLILETKHAGKITVKMSGVSGITSENALGIALEDYSPQSGTLEYRDGTQLFQGAESGEQTIDPPTLRLMWPEGTKMPKPAREWRGRLELGINGTSGNSDRFSAQGRTEARRVTDINKLLLYIQANYSENNGVRSQNESKIGGRYESEVSPRWSWYTRAEVEQDEFEEIDLRSTIVLGMSYSILEEQNQTLAARLGLGYQRESFEDNPTEENMILDFGYDYMLQVRDWARLTQDLTYYSGIDQPTEELRLVVNTAAEVPLTPGQQWKLRLGVTHEFDDQPVEGVENLDTTYFLNLVYDW